MNIIKIRLSELQHPEKNIRIHTETQINEFVRSIDMFGQIRPVVVDEDNTILAGNGLALALEKAGIETADAYQICGLSESQKKKLMIADNKIFGLGIENLDTLHSFLEDLSDDLDIPGFDEEILKSMVADADIVTEKISHYGILDDEEIQEIKDNGVRNQERLQKTDETAHPGQAIQEEPERKFVVCPECGAKVWL